MMKQALATAAAAGAILAAGSGVAAANTAEAPADNGKENASASLPETDDICNAPTKENPDKENTYLGVLKKDGFPLLDPLPLIEPETHVILGLCQQEEQKEDKGDGEDQGGEETPAPAPDGDGDNGGGNNDPSDPAPDDGGANFPAAAVL